MQTLSSPTSVRKSVSDRLQKDFLQKIRTGVWGPNQQIPPENHLARDYGACRSTVRRAIQELEKAGLLSAVQGRGRIVTAQSQASGKMIGLISSGHDISGGPGFQAAQALLHHAGQNGDHLATFAFSENQGGSMGDRLKMYADLAGAALFGPAFPSLAISELASRMPVVALARDERAHGVASFFIDYGYHALQATSELLQNGHKRILLTHGKKPFFDRVGANIEQGAEWAYALAGEPASQLIHIDAELHADGGARLYHQLKKDNTQPSAIISYGTWTVHGLLQEARKHEDRVYEKLPIIILNNLEDISLAGRVSYFSCPYDKLAKDAAETLFHLINGEKNITLYNPYRGTVQRPSPTR